MMNEPKDLTQTLVSSLVGDSLKELDALLAIICDMHGLREYQLEMLRVYGAIEDDEDLAPGWQPEHYDRAWAGLATELADAFETTSLFGKWFPVETMEAGADRILTRYNPGE